MANKHLIQSAKFKRDYVAYSAIILFFFIVIGEIFLALAIPAYVSRENVLALQENRIRMQQEFDGLRNELDHLKPATETGKCEIRLIRWHADRMAPYLRRFSHDLSITELSEIRRACRKLHHLAVSSAGNKPAAIRKKLETSAALDALVPPQKEQP